MNNLIVPIAADKPRYEFEMPSAFSIGDNGRMQCVEAIQGLPLEKFDKLFFVILKKHDIKFSLSRLFQNQFRSFSINAKVVVLDEPTASQPETVYQAVMKENISGSIFIKDADSFFKCETNGGNQIAVYPLEDLDWVNPKDKSYVAADDSSFVTNIIEKKIIGHLFSAGGYGFESVEKYCEAYEALQGENGLYLSHLIYWMLLRGEKFRPIEVTNYIDFNVGA